MGATFDLYFMLYPPAAVAERAAGLLRELGGQHPAGAAPMPADRLHITLASLGRYGSRVPEEVVHTARGVGSMLDMPPFHVSLDLLQSRNPGHAPGTVELAGRGPWVRPLRQFRQHLVAVMERQGLAQDPLHRAFVPHITLDYRSTPVARQVISPFCWRVTEFCLVASHFGQGRHEILARWPLQERQMPLAW